jgi:geranylgeranyl pyrophosphate synthase
MIDDIEDNSKLRRGVPVAHLVCAPRIPSRSPIRYAAQRLSTRRCRVARFGTPATINSANYVYFVAFKQVLDQDNRAAADAMISTLPASRLGS